MRGDASPAGDRPRATALTAAQALIRALELDAGEITIKVQHPRVIALLDVKRRFKPEELDLVALSGGAA